MLPLKNRINLKREQVFQKRKREFFSSFLFNFLLLEEKENFPPQFAIIVSKKIEKKASKRNRIKRILAAVIRGFLPEIKKGIRGVFLAKKEILEKDFWTIKREVELFLKSKGWL
ncbi:MAG: ribonuclease P protein component [Microgenomates group bacterium]